MLRQFLKDGLLYTFPSILSKGLSFLLVPFYTLVLSPADYGSLELFLIFASIVNLTITLEVSQGVARFYASEENNTKKVLYASSGFWFTVISNFLFGIIFFCFSPIISEVIMGQKGLLSSFQLGILYICITGVFYFVQNQLRWELRSVDYMWVSITFTVVTAITSLLFVYFCNFSLPGLLGGMVIGSVVGLFLALWKLRKSFKLQFCRIKLREMLQYSCPLILSGIAVWVTQYIDRIMLNNLLSIEEVGLYSLGFKVSGIIGLIIVSFQGSLTPLVFANYRKKQTPQQLAKIFRIFLTFSLISFLSITLFIKEILFFMTTASFYDASSVVVFLVPAILLSKMYIFAPGVGIAKKTHYILWINLFGGVLNIILNYYLINILGIVGAAVATLTCYFLIFIAYKLLSQKFYYIPHNWNRIYLLLIISIIIVSIEPFYSTSNYIRWSLNILSIILFSLFSIFLGFIPLHDIKNGYKILKKRYLNTYS